MVWADGRNNILKVEPISSVAQIKKIIGRNLEYLPKLLPSPVQEAPSPAQIVNSLTAYLKDNSKTLDSASLTQIRKDLTQLRTELQKPEVSANIDRQISAKRTILPKITPQRKEELLTATRDKDIEEANIRFTSVQSIITNINTCIARITDHLKSKQEPIIAPSATAVLNTHEATLQPSAPLKASLEEDIDMSQQLEKLRQQEAQAKATVTKQSMREVFSQFTQAKTTMEIEEATDKEPQSEELYQKLAKDSINEAELIRNAESFEKESQLELVRRKVEKSRKRKESRKFSTDNINLSAAKVPEIGDSTLQKHSEAPLQDENDPETLKKIAATARKIPEPISFSKREASSPAKAVPSLGDEEADLSNEQTQKVASASKLAQIPPRDLTKARGQLAQLNQKIKEEKRRLQENGQDFRTDVVQEQTSNELAKEQDAKQLIEELKQLTLDLKTAKSREDIDNIENRRSDWGNKEDEFYDKYLKNGDSDSKENEDILSRINQQNKLYGDALSQAELKVEAVVASSSSEESREEPEDVVAPKAPQLELLSREEIREKPVIEDQHARPPPAVPPPATDVPLKAIEPHKEPLLDSVSPGTTQQLANLSARLGSLEGELAESNPRQSVLHCPDKSVGVSFHKENFCTEFATEYNNIQEGQKINVIDDSNPSSPQESTDNPLTKRLSFSADGKTVTLPKDNIVDDTVCALNTIARSNLNKGSAFSDPVIKIKEVQEKDLLGILQKFNAGIIGDDSMSMGLQGRLQLSYKNPVSNSPNEQAIQDIIKLHNDLHSILQAGTPSPEEVNKKLAALQNSITELDKKLTNPEPSPVKPEEPKHKSGNNSASFR